MNINAAFDWKCHPRAEKLLLEAVEEAALKNHSIDQLQKNLMEKTSTRLFDWLDHVILPVDLNNENELKETGFTLQESKKDYKVYRHLGAQLPAVVLSETAQDVGLAVCVDSIADFILAHGGTSAHIEGSPFSGFRRCLISKERDVPLWIVERRGTLTMEPQEMPDTYLKAYIQASEKWKLRPRSLVDEDKAMEQTLALAQELADEVGRNLAAWIVLEGERQYWQARNLAGQLQKNRQDRLGMGWANHDHHTFRSSRRHFSHLVKLFEILGFKCRERFYAGQEAGWGAQVMENPSCRLILFLDVDLAPQEIEGDIAHEPLPELSEYGTIGLWCALHGDSILKAGMHHLEAQFMFDHLTHDLDQAGIKMMNPFSFFPYLKQAFTAGEMWPVDISRLQKLLDEKKITSEQAQKFSEHGAIGSHLENLQRREGYKGFNQKNVSLIIKKTDPRHQN